VLVELSGAGVSHDLVFAWEWYLLGVGAGYVFGHRLQSSRLTVGQSFLSSQGESREMAFDTLGLAAELLAAIDKQGYTEPSPIQARAIPAVLSGGDVVAAAQTGTGKTAAFVLPLLQKLRGCRGRGDKRPLALILTPTRELTAQVEACVQTYRGELPIRSTVIFGGVGMGPQINKLRSGVDLLVATPGRLLDHVQRGTLDLSQVRHFVLDEADRMLDMGFVHDVKKVIALLPAKRQNLLFSATYSPAIKTLAKGLLENPKIIEVAPENTTAETVAQAVYEVPRSRKRAVLSHLIKEGDWHQVLVFTRTKHGANRLARQLEQDGISSAAIHGNKSQSARTRALAAFKANEVQVLVATDVAARGIDVAALPHVVQYEMPDVAETYVHRIGRTGRAGVEGEAVALVDEHEQTMLRSIERLTKMSIPVKTLTGIDLTPSEKDRIPPPKPGQQRRPRKQNGPGQGQKRTRGGPPGAYGGKSGGSRRRGGGGGGNARRRSNNRGR
jgi:ATP-dependent RNA helicase RhlE